MNLQDNFKQSELKRLLHPSSRMGFHFKTENAYLVLITLPSMVDSNDGVSCLLKGLLTINSNVLGLEHSIRGTTSTS